MRKTKKYLISGASEKDHDLMKTLLPKLKAKGYQFVCRPEHVSIKGLLKKNNYFLAFQELIKRIFNNIHFYIFVSMIKNSKIIFLWPQMAGFNLLFKVIKHNDVSLYVMDNSFFCIRSYNTHPVKNSECLHCLGSINPHQLCTPFPINYNKLKNIKYLELLKYFADKISFLSQNELQKKLLKKHFGNFINVKVVGMDIGEIEKSFDSFKFKHVTYDIVFHGKSFVAKGLLYTVELAKLLPERTFLIPDSRENIIKFAEIESDLPQNITFKKMDWKNGLREMVISARLVINPSMWSAPIEGALIKSATLNQNVATVESIYGYEKEITSIKNHIRLSNDIFVASNQIKNFFK